MGVRERRVVTVRIWVRMNSGTGTLLTTTLITGEADLVVEAEL